MRRIRRSLSAARLDPVPAGLGAGLSDKVSTTPLLVQDDFGYGGAQLPADGLSYCGPTAVAMSLLWLGKNGWNQIGPTAPTQADALNLDLLLGGMADTSPLGGTVAANLQDAVASYLNAGGIPSSAFTYPPYYQPSVDSIVKLNQNQTVVTLLLGWYVPVSKGSNAYKWVGGHFVAILGQGNPDPADLTIGNPCPSALQSVPDLPEYALQRLTTSNFTGTSADLPQPPPGTYYLQFPDITWPGSTQAVTPVLQSVYALTIDMSERSSNHPPVAQWRLDSPQTIDTNSASLTVLAPLAGAGGLVKQGLGGLALSAANSTSGSNQIAGGSLASGQGSGPPLGAGGIALSGGTLVVDPGGTGAEVALTAAGGQNSQVAFSGAAALQLVVGANKSLAVSLGGAASGNQPGLVQAALGALVISVDAGAPELGSTCTLTVPAGIGGLAPASSPIIAPWIVARSPQSAGVLDVLDFLAYGKQGFVLPGYTSSKHTNINSASASDVYSVDTPQILKAGATAAVFALKAGPYTVSSAGTNAVLKIGPQQAGQTAGMILNGTTLTGFQLDFGSFDAAVYATDGAEAAAVGADISGSGKLTFLGPGTLGLSGANDYTGGTLVLAGLLAVGGSSPTGSGPITIQGVGTLNLQGTVAGAISAEDGGTVMLQSGTAAGSLDVDDQSTLAGVGCVSGAATVTGQILAGPSPGTIEFQGAATFTEATLFTWTLFDLDDDATAGQNPWWNSLIFTTSEPHALNIGADGSYVQFILDMTKLGPLDPNSDNAFWTSPHVWTVFEAQNVAFNNLWYALVQPQFRMGYFTLSNDENLRFLYLNFVPSVV